MKNWKTTLRKIVLRTALILFIIMAVVIIFISPIAKYVINNYGEKFTGRKLHVDWVYLNPFTGYAHLHGLNIYEYKSDTIFVSAKGISVDFAMLKLLSKEYEISSVTLNKPWARVIQNRDRFNFSDLIEKFASKEPKDTTGPPTHFSVLDINLIDGEFHYVEQVVPVNYFIKNVNLECPGQRWNVDTVYAKYAFESGPGSGSIKGDATINLKTMGYRIATVVNKFDLSIMEQYLKDIADYGSFRANLDADIKAAGNMNNELDVDATGFVAVNDFHFGKDTTEDYTSFKKLVVDMDRVHPSGNEYIFDSIMVDRPFFKYERYDSLDNISLMFGVGGSKYEAVEADQTKVNLIVEIAHYLNKLAKNFIQSYYHFDKVAIYAADIHYNDFTPREKFGIAASPLYIYADSVDKRNPRMKAHMQTGIKPYGNFTASVSINPNDYGDFDLYYHLQKLPLSLFNPFVVSYTSFPLDRGSLEFKGGWNVRNSQIDSRNHLLILDPKVGKRIRKQDTKWIPVPLILSILKERAGVIDYEIPVQGNLKDPKFKVWDVVFDILGNIFTKPPVSPYLVHISNVEKEVEKFLTMKWDMRQTELRPVQERFVEKMADFLRKNPEAHIDLYPLVYVDKEKEHLLLFEAKKKYFLRNTKQNTLSEEDSITVDKMSVKDSSFVAYLERKFGDSVFTIQQRALRYVGEATVNARYSQLMKAREATFKSYFEKEGVAGSIKWHGAQNEVPFNGTSYYKIEYKGDFPDKLIDAYNEMDEIYRENPRGKYKKDRDKNGGLIRETKEVSTN